ncbi:family transcriptional regulator [Micractinium conductrix]|uniref:7-cyano-7-deazaguanine synthase n=1 Tax=Micractinium conductrix TaxID=554055 RepID=A0A2P6VLC8_9CHLO|nr:family transcriptional regulator [Micractinium conductrix]|eukprot:PSC74888.1 family transcriptional regulator [Micractinium conductrix]
MLRVAESLGSLAALRGTLPALGAALLGAPRALSSGTVPCQAGIGRYLVTGGLGHELGDEEPTTAPPRQGSTVVLVSGGIESAALLSYWCHWDMKERLLPVYIDYGQKNRQEEEHAMLALCRHLGLELNAINASMVAHQLNMAKPRGRYHDPLPHRNLLLLSLAASFAADTGATNVAICLNRDHLGTYSSASLPFLRTVEALYGTLDPPAQLLMPLLGLRADQIITLGEHVKAPWHLTYSCAEGKATPCGRCPSCERRAAAFDRADVKDTLLECRVHKGRK